MERKLTIKRAMTRVKTIQGQLNTIAGEIAKYGAWNSQQVHPLASRGLSLERGINQAQEYVASQFQKFDDLTKELIKLKTAIAKANLSTKIYFQVEGKDTVEMTIQEALAYKHHVSDYVRALVSSYNRSVSLANTSVDKTNAAYANKELSEDQKKVLLAQVLYLVPASKVQELDSFLAEFMNELDGAIDESIGVTELVLED